MATSTIFSQSSRYETQITDNNHILKQVNSNLGRPTSDHFRLMTVNVSKHMYYYINE